MGLDGGYLSLEFGVWSFGTALKTKAASPTFLFLISHFLFLISYFSFLTAPYDFGNISVYFLTTLRALPFVKSGFIGGAVRVSRSLTCC